MLKMLFCIHFSIGIIGQWILDCLISIFGDMTYMPQWPTGVKDYGRLITDSCLNISEMCDIVTFIKIENTCLIFSVSFPMFKFLQRGIYTPCFCFLNYALIHLCLHPGPLSCLQTIAHLALIELLVWWQI